MKLHKKQANFSKVTGHLHQQSLRKCPSHLRNLSKSQTYLRSQNKCHSHFMLKQIFTKFEGISITVSIFNQMLITFVKFEQITITFALQEQMLITFVITFVKFLSHMYDIYFDITASTCVHHLRNGFCSIQKRNNKK